MGPRQANKIAVLCFLVVVMLCGPAVFRPDAAPGAQAQAPAAAPAAAPQGSVTIQVTQGTQGGSSVGGLTVQLDLSHNGRSIQRSQVKLDAQGKAVVGPIPVIMAFQPVVSVEFGGVSNQAAGNVVDPEHPQGQVSLKVYDSTDQEPAWSIAQRTLMVHPGEKGVRVIEMYSVDNPADRTWIGPRQPDGRHPTLHFQLPPGATAVECNGLKDGSAGVSDGKLTWFGPLQPGNSRFQFSYQVAPESGKIHLDVKASHDIKDMAMFVPERAQDLVVTGLDNEGAFDAGRGPAQRFHAANIKAGQEVTLVMAPLALPEAMGAGSKPGAATSGMSTGQMIIAGLAVLVLLAGIGVVLFLKPKNQNNKGGRNRAGSHG